MPTTHADYRADYNARIYHGDLCDNGRGGTSAVIVIGYEPDPRCPDLVVWSKTADGGRVPGFRKGWTREAVQNHLAQLADHD